jgi:threonyl-tRNA synthetase
VPQAVRVPAVPDAHAAFAGDVADRLRAAGVRAGVDDAVREFADEVAERR